MVVVAQHCPRTEVRWHGLATWADRCRATIAVDLEEMESPTSMVLSGQHRAGVPSGGRGHASSHQHTSEPHPPIALPVVSAADPW